MTGKLQILYSGRLLLAVPYLSNSVITAVHTLAIDSAAFDDGDCCATQIAARIITRPVRAADADFTPPETTVRGR